VWGEWRWGEVWGEVEVWIAVKSFRAAATGHVHCRTLVAVAERFREVGCSLNILLVKNVQVTEEAFSSQKRPSNTSKHELLKFFSTFVGHFCLPGSGSGFRIRIGSTDPIESGWSGSATLDLMTKNYEILELKNPLPWRTSKLQAKLSALKKESFFVGQFFPLGSGSSRPNINAQHWFHQSKPINCLALKIHKKS
jgi:hypothetical protein